MSSDQPAPKEGWGVPARAPLLAMVILIVSLATAVFVLGHVYNQTIQQQTHPPLIRFPSPELERVQTPPDRTRPDYRQPGPAGIDAAMAATAREGDALWQGARP